MNHEEFSYYSDEVAPARPLIREWSLDATGNSLAIPLPQRTEPVTRQYIVTVNMAQNLWENFKRAAAIHASDPYAKYSEYGYLPFVSWIGIPRDGDVFPHDEGVLPHLEQRYAQGLHILRPLVEILMDGFGPHNSFPEFTQRELTQALYPYELAVMPGVAPHDRTEQAAPARADMAQHIRASDSVVEQLRENAARLGIPEEHWTHPTVQQFLGLHLVSQELSRVSMGDTGSGQLRPTLGPPLPERYMTTASFATSLTAILEEGLQGQRVQREFLQNTFDAGLRPYQLRVVDNPARNPFFPDK